MQGNPLLLIPILGPMLLGLLVHLVDRLRPRWRDPLVLAGLALCLLAALGLALPVLRGQGEESLLIDGVCGLGLSLRLDGFRAIYLLVTALMWLVSGIFSREYFAHSRHLGRYWLFCLLTLGATLGVFLSSSLYTTFLFFEVMSFTSYPMVAHEENDAALRAAGTYLAVAVGCGMVMLLGLMWLYTLTGTLELGELYVVCKSMTDKSALYLPGVLILVGFGAKAGMFPLHIWLPKAHPVAPAPASALLSGVLTKSGVFGVLTVGSTVFLHDARWGLLLLFPALVTMLLGAVLALFSNDLKRTLACSSVSQIGFILTGASMQGLLGDHNALAVRGTLLHMVNHSLFKLILFLAAGMVYTNLHRLDLNAIRGFGRGRPVFAFLFGMGALGIAGVPGWSGYVSKTLLHESIVEAIEMYHGSPLAGLLRGGELVFLFTGGLTVAYMAKLCVVLFLEKPPADARAHRRTATPATLAALALPAAALPVLGMRPRLMDALAALGEGFLHGHAPDHAVHYFAWSNLRGAVISLAVGAAVFFAVVRPLLTRPEPGGGRRYLDRWPGALDLEALVYRPVGRILTLVLLALARIVERLPGWIVCCLDPVLLVFARVAETLPGGIVRLVRTRLLAPSRPKPYPGRFLGRFYWLFYPREEKLREPAFTGGGISFSLLLLGAGMTVLLVYIFLRSLL